MFVHVASKTIFMSPFLVIPQFKRLGKINISVCFTGVYVIMT